MAAKRFVHQVLKLRPSVCLRIGVYIPNFIKQWRMIVTYVYMHKQGCAIETKLASSPVAVGSNKVIGQRLSVY